MTVVGLTGSIGMGKSAVTAMFRRAGVPVFDADAAVHILQGSGGVLLPEIEARFPGTTGPAGVDRAKLGAAVFGKPDELKALERIVHPAVARMRAHWLRRNRSLPVVVLDVPLLFEKKGWRTVDVVVVVSAPAWMQRKRVLARPGMTAGKFRRILALQTPDAEKRRRADYVITTGCLKHETEAQVRHLVACLRAKRRR
ncbi:MAG: dephospho-CoA kinase [Sphingomonadales bacterium]|jgi:dephospho-CoA kinase|nr:dephospho-CoA kinase [Sphingomonadales bacterium]MBK6721120.1 dephospho-CoA kinase [Sphingomonadales bacterium]MBK8272597.1 dephospho-CoA kinase [Sphingomonadales bacterium]MBK8861953.1 dephospho-CoA kinase [Sphingomonadales bacterium]MBK9588278.1 dephospho-CoA kinase [Sphingomonadales bacterium]